MVPQNYYERAYVFFSGRKVLLAKVSFSKNVSLKIAESTLSTLESFCGWVNAAGDVHQLHILKRKYGDVPRQERYLMF